MRTPRQLWLPVAVVLAFAGCRDATAPSDGSRAGADVVDWASSTPLPNFLRQAPTAPPLETYEVSFWAVDGAASTVTVNYRPTGDETEGRPFLHFEIPKNGLSMDADGVRFKRGDSVLVTLTIDPVNFAVDFQPSGLWFSRGHSARLTMWYENADPDLTSDGVVDAADQACAEDIALWGHTPNTRWVRLRSQFDATLPSVSTYLRHFSEYAVSW